MSTDKEQTNLKWTRQQVAQYKREFKTYEDYAKCLHSILEELVTPIAPLAIIQSRPKSVSSFAEKIQRKKDKYDNPVRQLTDLCGARIIVQTRSQVDRICRLIESNLKIDQANSEDKESQLKPEEFGYTSRHYIVSISKGSPIYKNTTKDIPSHVLGHKAEVQVRTVLQHAWADVQHDLTYKGGFTVHDELKRGLARLAAMLEEADKDFDHIVSGLAEYRCSYGTYMTSEQIRDEIALLDTVLKLARDPQTAARIGKLAMCAGNWSEAIDTLSRFAKSNSYEILRDLGVSICKAYDNDPESDEYARGRRYLTEAWELSGGTDADAITNLGRAWLRTSSGKKKAGKCYKLAYDLDPTDPYVLESYLNYEIARHKDLRVIDVAEPTIRESVERCGKQAQIGVNMPWAYFSIGKFRLLLGDLAGSIDAYARGITMSSDGWMLQSAHDSLDRLTKSGVQIAGISVISKVLLMGLAARFGDANAKVLLGSDGAAQPDLASTAVIAYGIGASDDRDTDDASSLLADCLDSFNGRVLMGVHSQLWSSQASTPKEYRGLPRADCAVGEAIAQWASLVSSGVNPGQTKVVGTGGNAASGAGYRVALALGCQVGLIEDSSGEASSVLSDRFWRDHGRLLPLALDRYAISAFLGDDSAGLSDDQIDEMARRIHSQHKRDLLASLDPRTSPDPALWEWEHLGSSEKGLRLQESSRQSARDMARKLRLIGYEVCPAQDAVNNVVSLCDEDYEEMAKMEHARWMLERLSSGWQYGKEKDSEKKISPSLVAWEQLDETIQDWDRSIVRQVPDLLAAAGLAIVKRI